MEPLTLDDLNAAIDDVDMAPALRNVRWDRFEDCVGAIRPGDLYWHLSGAESQLPQALLKGACAGVVSREDHSSERAIRVDDPRRAFQDVARWYRGLLDTLIVAQPVSALNPLTRYYLQAAMGEDLVAGDEFNYRTARNVSERVARSILQLTSRNRLAVIDVTTKELGLARPDLAIVPRIGGRPQAVGAFLEHLPRGGFLVHGSPYANCDGEVACGVLQSTGRRSFRSERIRFEVRDTGEGRSLLREGPQVFDVPGDGAMPCQAAGLAIVVARQLGVADSVIANNLREAAVPAGYASVPLRAPWTIVNASRLGSLVEVPVSAARLVHWEAQGRRVFVHGDTRPSRLKRSEADVVETLGRDITRIDYWVSIGTNARQYAQGLRHAGMDARCLAEFSECQRASRWLRELARSGDVFWINGTSSAQFEALIADLIRHADAEGMSQLAA